MFKLFLAACLAFVFLGLACSHEKRPQNQPEEQHAQPATVSTPPQHSRPVIAAFGDSLTAGVVEHTYPEYLQNLLDQNGYKYHVVNDGVSGETSSDGLVRLESVIAQHPALILLEFGGNDGLRGTPPEEIEKNLAAMIEKIQAAHIPLVLLGITLPPNYGADYLQQFNAIYPALAHKYHLRFIPFLLAHVYQHQEMMQPDGIHPSASGNQVVASDVFELIKPMLKHE